MINLRSRTLNSSASPISANVAGSVGRQVADDTFMTGINSNSPNNF